MKGKIKNAKYGWDIYLASGHEPSLSFILHISHRLVPEAHDASSIKRD